MKKLIAVSILLTLLTAAAFAQFGFKITGEFYPDVLKVTTPIGDAAQVNNEKTLAGTVPYLGVGTVDILTLSDWPAGKGLTAEFSYKERDGERYGGLIALSMGRLIERGYYFFNKSDVSDQTVSFVELLNSGIGDWNMWGKVGLVKGVVGNSGVYEGSVTNFDGPFNFLSEGKFLDYGIVLPGDPSTDGYGYYGVGNGINVRGVRAFPIGQRVISQAVATAPSQSDRPVFQASVDLAPITVAVTGDMSNILKDSVGGVNSLGYSTVGGSLLVSGAKVADLVSFDAIYKFAGGDYDRENLISPNSQPDGTGNWGHAFGLYANLHLLDTLGLGLGYSGFTSVQEKSRDINNEEFTYSFPYYNGVNLNVNFTGVDKLNISFDNNISFSTIRGSDDTHRYTVGLLGLVGRGTDSNDAAIGGSPFLTDSDKSEGYIALSNTLGAKYNISDPLFVSFQVFNRLYSYTETMKVNADRGRSEEITLKYGANNFRAALGAGYNFSDHVVLESGLLFDLLTHSGYVSNDDSGNNNYDWGTFSFAIPVHFKVVLP
jgi:hypothetical protein